MTDALKNLSFRALFDAAVEAKLLVDDTGHIVLANQTAQLLFGYSEDELCKITVEMLMPARYREQHQHYRALFLNNPDKRAMGDGKALAALHRDGTEMILDISLSPIKTQKQLYILIAFIITDQRLKTEEALRASEERLRLAKQAASLGIFDCDCENKIIYWDEQMRRLWGEESNDSVTYNEFLPMIHPEDRAARKAAYKHAIDPTGNGEFSAEFRVIHPRSGIEHWISTIGRVHFEAGHAKRLVGVAQDITEKKSLQKKLQDQRNEIASLFKHQVAERTASAIAHELNQPLTAISAYSEVVLQALANQQIEFDKVKKALEGCVEQAQRAGRSLHELLAFLQKGEIKSEQLNLNSIINESLSIVREDGYGEFHHVLNLQQDLPAVQANRTQILKVLVNLIKNAAEAMLIANVPISTITISVQTFAETNMAIVIIQDNGPGLDKDMAKRIFEPFFLQRRTISVWDSQLVAR